MIYEFTNKIEPNAQNSINVLIDKSVLENVLKLRNDEDALKFIKDKLTPLPKDNWVVRIDKNAFFFLPFLMVRDEELFITDGRHRICWMIEMGMNKIPISISRKDISFLQSNGINYKETNFYNMPCDYLPNQNYFCIENTIPPSEVMKKLKICHSRSKK